MHILIVVSALVLAAATPFISAQPVGQGDAAPSAQDANTVDESPESQDD